MPGCCPLFDCRRERSFHRPGADASAQSSSYLAGTAESFLTSCRADLDNGKKRIAAIKATPPPRDALATLQAFDTALVVMDDAANRAQLAEQTHPSKPFRDAAQICEQEVSGALTDVSLDQEMYKVLASLDGSKLDAAGTYFLKTDSARLPSRRRRPG